MKVRTLSKARQDKDKSIGVAPKPQSFFGE